MSNRSLALTVFIPLNIKIDNEVCDKLIEKCTYDGSVLVRAELAAAIQWFLIDFESRFCDLCLELDKKMLTYPGGGTSPNSRRGERHSLNTTAEDSVVSPTSQLSKNVANNRSSSSLLSNK